MNTRMWLSAVATLILSGTASIGQGPIITSFRDNGRVTWTNAVNTNAIYRLEWASQAGGPWHAFTYQPINTIDAHSSTVFEVEVPMFYRVVLQTNESPQRMVWIDGGDVELGAQISVQGAAAPVHTNFISGFWMDATEISKSQWDAVAGWAGSNQYDIGIGDGAGKTNNHPVQSVTWYMCVKWCNARSQMEGLTPCYYIDPIYFNLYQTGNRDISNSWVNWAANGYRLPTEAEWEKAARGGHQGRLYPWGGDTIQHARANYFANNAQPYDTSPTTGYHPSYTDVYPYTSPVGSFAANGYGLYDMAGNVYEWCWDWYANYSADYHVDPHGPATGQYGALRVNRGGSWLYQGIGDTRCAFHEGFPPDYVRNNFGFRCVRGP